MSAIVVALNQVNEPKAMLNDMGFDVMLQAVPPVRCWGAFFLGNSDHASGTELDAAGGNRLRRSCQRAENETKKV
ncbi:MAG: hypothetical protein ACLR6J_12255 [Parabacteroides merdae]